MSRVQVKSDSSMEDVLASIKQIISDDLDNEIRKIQPSTSTTATTEPKVDSVVEDDIIELTQEVDQNNKVVTFNGQDITKGEAVASCAISDPHRSRLEAPAEESLISAEVLKVSTEALQELDAFTNSVKPSQQDNIVANKTIEDLMKEMMRPLLKDWLDAHLPSLVKGVVSEQIEKMVQKQTKA